MYYTKQDDYDSFKCIADRCPKTCCESWLIEIDENSLKRYKSEQGPFSTTLKDGINWTDGTFKLFGNRCSMLNDNNLCKMQLALGEDALCYTCRMYPRHVEEYEDLRELSLSLSCPEVARMIVTRDIPYTFTESEDDLEENYDDYEDFDFLLHSSLEYAREKIYSILLNREQNIFLRMANVLCLCKQLQECIANDMVCDMDEVTDNYEYEITDHSQFLRSDMAILRTLEVLDNTWFDDIDTATKYCSKTDYMQMCDMITQKECIVLENICVLLIYAFFCGSVYDDEIYSKAALCVMSTLWIYEIYRSKTDVEDLELLQTVIYSYASEVEHSDDNLLAIEKAFR